MSSLKDKLRFKKGLKEQIEKEDSGRDRNDKRFLNYYDMKVGEKMELIIIPDTNGNLWAKYKKHGPNLKVRGLQPIGCAHVGGSDCPICQRAYDYLDQDNKEEAKKWFPSDYTVMSVLVIDSPIEVNEAEDGNQVKLMHVPYSVEAMIKNALSEGQIDEDEISMYPFVLKKTENKGGRPAYDQSFFDRKPVPDEVLEVFDDGDLVVEFFDYENLDIIPEPPTEEEAEEWLETAIEKYNKRKSSKGGKGRSRDEDTDDSDEGEADDSDDSQNDADDREEEKKSKPSSSSSLRERLRKAGK